MDNARPSLGRHTGKRHIKVCLSSLLFTKKSIFQLRHNNFPHDIHGMFCRRSAMGGNAHCANTLKLLICLSFVSFLVPTVVALNGTYVIQSHADPNLVIGANVKGTSDEKKVITDGDMVVVRPSPLVFFANGARISHQVPTLSLF